MYAAAIVLLLHVCHIEDREEDSDEYSESGHEVFLSGLINAFPVLCYFVVVLD